MCVCVSGLLSLSLSIYIIVQPHLQILGDITGNLDAKKACNEALKIHKKYLKVCMLCWIMTYFFSQRVHYASSPKASLKS